MAPQRSPPHSVDAVNPILQNQHDCEHHLRHQARNPRTGSLSEELRDKRGLAYSRLGQNDRARESFETVMKNYPNSEGSRLAKQVLDRLARGGREQNED